MNLEKTREYTLKTPLNGTYFNDEFNRIYENFTELDANIGQLTALRDRIKTAIPPEALDLITAVNKIDEWLQTHAENVNNPHSVKLSQLTNDTGGVLDAVNRKVTNLTNGTASTDAINKSQLDSAISTLKGLPPSTLDTLAKLATAINNDPSFATTINNALATKSNTNHNHNATYSQLGHGHSPSEVGLGNVTNNKQIRTTSTNDIQLNWIGSQLQAVVDVTPFNLLTSADISGKLDNASGISNLVLKRYAVNNTSSVPLSALQNNFGFAGLLVTSNSDIRIKITNTEYAFVNGASNIHENIDGYLYYWATA